MLMGKLFLSVNEARTTLERPRVLVKRSVTESRFESKPKWNRGGKLTANGTETTRSFRRRTDRKDTWRVVWGQRGNNKKISITSSRKAQENQTARCKEKEDSEVPQYCCSIDCQGSRATGEHQLTETQQWSKTVEIISGASDSVMPTSMCQPVPSLESVGNRNSVRKTIAVGDTVLNEGERLTRGYTAPGGTKNLAMLQKFTNPLCAFSNVYIQYGWAPTQPGR